MTTFFHVRGIPVKLTAACLQESLYLEAWTGLFEVSVELIPNPLAWYWPQVNRWGWDFVAGVGPVEVRFFK